MVAVGSSPMDKQVMSDFQFCSAAATSSVVGPSPEYGTIESTDEVE